VQYHAPVYRTLQQDFGVPVSAIYGSDYSVAGSLDPEFNARVAWDVDLLDGYSHRFLRRVSQGGGRSSSEVSTKGLSRALLELRPAAILLLGYSPRFHQLAFWAASRTRRPLLFRGETTDHAVTRSPLRAWLRDHALRRFYAAFARLLYVGERSRSHFSRLGCPSERMVFSPYCIDPSPFRVGERERDEMRARMRAELGLPEDRIVLLFSGKLSRRKGVDVLLAAVKAMKPTLRERVVIVFLGSGELSGELQREAAASPLVSVLFTGFRNQTELSPYYHAADLLVLPSVRSETWGLVVNDALHHGLPCVVSDAVGCAPDLIIPGETGEIGAVGSADSLGSAIARALPLIGRVEVRNACRSRVEQYSVRNAAGGIARAYADALS
jgi:glycosyltransferase involved in cell wall biosynthesis